MRWFKPIFLILILTVMLQALQGQNKIRFNVHFDPQFAWLSSSDHNKIDPDGSVFNMQAGIQMDYYFQENYAFVLGFGINNLGGNLFYAESEDYGTPDTIVFETGQSVKMNLQYLDIPLGLKLKTEELGYATFFLQVGFNPMFNINAHASTKDGELDKKTLPKESIAMFNLGYHVGIGVEYRLGGNTAAIGGIRWTSGLTNVTQEDGANISVNAISIHLGILF
jgi:opacity protein-like surface antigen